MLHHISIPASDPRHVSEVLAELMKGRSYPFPGPVSGAFMAVSGDPHGTMIEVYPAAVVLEPGKGDDGPTFVDTIKSGGGAPPASTAFHALVSVPREREEIECIGAREGWLTKYIGRGVPGRPPVFHVIEVWIENRLMLEVVSQEMAAGYAQVLQFARLDQHFGMGSVG
ncbi:hypothetical protein GCM10007874_05910 [Labrys miyagiensis]|uniref:Uncharacterized protein n=1 Tax=Labrys miyagiensis TaxID=346912 RepID=A0ABQ6CB14_9HYPH|nr:hypothetical protein [Labrys miyagiensis]GLS17576.1 hypothetical protein GCM10007874_05910 [Labrys miyagiensis]